MDPRLQTPLFIGSIGLIFFVVGTWTAWSTWAAPPDPVLALAVIDARSLAPLEPGTEVLAEGRLAGTSVVLRGGLALVQREVATGVTRPGSNEVRFSWVAEGTEAPPFELETPAGVVRVRLAPEASWLEAPRVVEENPGAVTAGKKRLSGFAPADALTVRAKVVKTPSGPGLEADVLSGGTAQDYRSSVTNSGRVGLVLGALFALVGLGALLTALVQATAAFRA